MLPPLLSIHPRKDNAMSKEIQIFKNEQFGQIRTIDENGKVLFCGSDVAKALGYKRPNDAISAHCKGTVKRRTPTNGGMQEMLFVTEGDIYRLAASSELPGADAFESWIFDEVLPSIRKHGEYVSPRKAQQRLGEVNSAARIIRQTLREAGMAPQFVAVAMKSLYEPVGVEIPLEGITLNKRLFDATAIADRLGVMSRSGKPHAHAVSAIIAQVDVLREEKELVPFQSGINGHSGTNMQYTESVVAKVNLWLERHGYPTEISYKGKQYTVRYARAA